MRQLIGEKCVEAVERRQAFEEPAWFVQRCVLAEFKDQRLQLVRHLPGFPSVYFIDIKVL
jgi:hypothetical protein